MDKKTLNLKGLFLTINDQRTTIIEIAINDQRTSINVPSFIVIKG